MVFLALELHQLPDDVAEGMSEEWYWKTMAYLEGKAAAKAGPGGGSPLPTPSVDELNDMGQWFLTG